MKSDMKGAVPAKMVTIEVMDEARQLSRAKVSTSNSCSSVPQLLKLQCDTD